MHSQRCSDILQSRILPVFLRTNLHRSILQDNRRRALECLRNISANGGALLQETLILAWGEVARYDRYRGWATAV